MGQMLNKMAGGFAEGLAESLGEGGEGDQGSEGADAATAQLNVIAALSEAGMGISYVFPSGRNDGVSHEDIIRWQAEGNSRSANPIKRDIRPNQEDADEIGRLFLQNVDKQLERVGKETASGGTVSKEDAARAGGAGGLRAAAKYQAKVMYERIEAQVDNNGQGLIEVGAEYAIQRAIENGVNNDVVLFKTGQLANALESGQYRLFFDTGKVQKMLSLIGR